MELNIYKGCVYFFRHIGLSPVKIGRSSHDSPASRFEQFSTYAPYGSEIVGFIMTEKYIELESHLHKKFANKRLSGEWFDITIEDCEREINFYTAKEDIEDRNEFQKAWAKNILQRKELVNESISDISKKNRFKKLYESDSKLNIMQTCKDMGISRVTAYRWIKSFKKP